MICPLKTDKRKNVKRLLKWIALAVIAFLGVLVLLPIAVIQIAYRIFSKKYDLWYYFCGLAVGADALGGSLVYGSKRHTISAKCGEHAYYSNRKFHLIHGWVLERFVDLFFGVNHCRIEAIEEGLISGLSVESLLEK